jgi:hypothetical protein
MAKGIELPVNVLVVIVIAVLVLIALATLVATGILSLTPVQAMLEKNTACASYACGAIPASSVTINVDVDGDPNSPDTLEDLCIYEKRCTEGSVTEADIKRYCGCPIL